MIGKRTARPIWDGVDDREMVGRHRGTGIAGATPGTDVGTGGAPVTRVRLIRSRRDFEAVVAIRERVFRDEQGLISDRATDDDDAGGTHAVAEVPDGEGGNVIVSAARLTVAGYLDEVGQASGQITWVATLPEWRGRGLGASVVSLLLDHADAMVVPSVAISAQAHAVAFYGRLGFVPRGRRFEVAGITHLTMVRPLRYRPIDMMES